MEGNSGRSGEDWEVVIAEDRGRDSDNDRARVGGHAPPVGQFWHLPSPSYFLEHVTSEFQQLPQGPVIQRAVINHPHKRLTESLNTDPRIKRENDIGYIPCKVHGWPENAGRENEGPNVRT